MRGMRLVQFLLALIITTALVFFLNRPLELGDKSIPPIGKLMNPYTGFWKNATPIHELPEGTLDFPNLKGKVTVHYDDRMVPHIFAEHNEDALFAQGYITAQNRLFQMDLSSRATEGRLSEILGKRALKRDIRQRRKGMVFAAENALEEWKKHDYGWKMLMAYCDGVNAYISSLGKGDYPLEYKLIGTTPDKWTPKKTALFVKAMAASLAGGHYDIEATNTLKKFKKDTFDFLYPDYDPLQTPIIPKSKKWDFDPVVVEDDTTDNDIIDYFDYKIYERSPEGVGSNNWVVSGKRTVSGNPILCGDPHLDLSLPSIWYEMQLQTPELNAYGVSLPGIPFIVIGFNENIAWSQTNVGHDVTDFYQIKWKDENKMQYLYDGEYKDVELKIEKYHVKDVGGVLDTVRYTVWGPVTYESKTTWNKDLATQWLAHFASDKNELTTFYELNKAKNFDDYYKAIDTYNVPAQNFVFASKEGDIAIRVMGQFPLKEENQGRFVRDGSLSSSGWKGFIPKAHNPIIKNPARGYVSSANQYSTSPTYPYEYNREKFEPFRGRMANRLLAKKNKATIQDMKDMQNNNFDMKSEAALPLMLAHLDSAQIRNNRELIGALENWDNVFTPDSKAATFFTVWWRKLFYNIWDEMNQDIPLLYPTTERTIYLMKEVSHSVFFDDRRTEDKEDIKNIVTRSFMEAKEKLGDKIPVWTKFQKSRVDHLAKIPAFSRYDLGVGGAHSTLNAMTDIHGPSWRQIVELGDEVKALVSYPGGQSGNPGSPYYDNFIDTWAKGEYYEALFMKNENDHQRMMVAKQVFE